MLSVVWVSCGNRIDSHKDLSRGDKEFIRNLGILDADEDVIMFTSNSGAFSGLETSGNFFTDKRIASYWIDRRDSANTTIKYAFYRDIDTIWRYPKFNALTLASYLEVHKKSGDKFKVYVSADSAGTWLFFNRALEEWNRKKDFQ